jgi:hypothetical protein
MGIAGLALYLGVPMRKTTGSFSSQTLSWALIDGGAPVGGGISGVDRIYVYMSVSVDQQCE